MELQYRKHAKQTKVTVKGGIALEADWQKLEETLPGPADLGIRELEICFQNSRSLDPGQLVRLEQMVKRKCRIERSRLLISQR